MAQVEGATNPNTTSRWLALGHPPFVLALALLATNDALLKQAFPGWWTGKLSDLAGVFVIAVVLGIATRRPWTADVLTAVGFAALKLSPLVAGLAAPLLGGVTRTDATDLVALVALVPAHRFVAHHVVPRTDGRPWQVPLTALAVSLTVFSVSATSCGDDAVGIQRIEVGEDGAVYAIAEVPDAYAPDYHEARFRSDDGGRTWERIFLDEGERPPDTDVVSEDEACTEDGRCFRVTQDAGGPVGAVQTERDGGWVVSSTLDTEQVRRIDLRRGFAGCGDDLAEEDVFSSVAVVDGPDGDHVLVTMGTEGVQLLEPRSEGWERVGVGRFEPTSLRGPSWLDRLGWAPVLVTTLLAVGLLVLIVVGWRNRATNAAVALAVTVVGGGALVVAAFLATSIFDTDYAVRGPVLAVLSVLLAVLSVCLALRRPRAEPVPPSAAPPSEPQAF